MVQDENTVNEPYIAILVYESAGDAGDYVPLYCEDIVLLWAGNEEQARAKAERRAAEAETSYQNAAGNTITWRLKHVIDVNPALEDDTSVDADLYSRHFRDYDAYRKFEPYLSGTVD